PISPVLGSIPLEILGYLSARLLILVRDLAKFFGVQALGAGHRIHLVTKHHGQMAPLGLRTSALFLLRQQRSATLAAESKSWGILKPTLRTAEIKQTGTLATKLHSLGVLKPTAWALHDQNSLRRRLSRFSQSEVRVG